MLSIGEARGTFGALGSGSSSMVFEPRLTLRLKAQSIEPVYKTSLQYIVIHYLLLFLELLLLGTKN
jgi:hypothetical protein